MARRLNRGISPAMLSAKDQELLVRSAENDDLMKEAVEVLTGQEWHKLNFGQRLTAVNHELEKSRSAAVITQAIRARSDLREAIDIVKTGVSTEEKLERTQNELTVTRQALSESEQRIAELIQDASSLPPRSRS